MAEEMFMRSNMLSNMLTSPETWIAVVYVLCMFTVLAFRPQQISAPYSFRLSYIFFALYFIIPGLINATAYLVMMDGGMGRGGSGVGAALAFQLSAVLSKILLGMSIVLALSSLRRHGGQAGQDD